jgi:hypothetical protein
LGTKRVALDGEASTRAEEEDISRPPEEISRRHGEELAAVAAAVEEP